jgi:hypothetical protein
MSYQKTPLNFDLYAKYEIPQEYQAYIVILNDVEQQRLDDIELELQQSGHKIFHTEVNRSEKNLFDITLIVAQMSMTF